MNNHLEFQLEELECRRLLSTVQVLAAGYRGEEIIELQVDQTTVATWQLNDSATSRQFQTFEYQTNANLSGDQIRIRFTNDRWDPQNGIDRNAVIDAIVVDGQRIETESTQVYSTGTWKPLDGIQPGFRESEYLHTDGYLEFYNANTGSKALKVVARGQSGEENMSLAIRGTVVQIWENVGTSFSEYSYNYSGDIQPDEVRVIFNNDRWVPEQGIDRNLIVDRIEIEDIKYETESSSVFSTGTWRPEDGIVPGFRTSEFLHTNGYFEYSQENSGAFALAANFLIASESQGSIDVTINRVNGSDGQASVDFETFDLTATAGSDYVAQSGTLEFASGEFSKTVTIPILSDELVEPAEQFSFVIDNALNAGLLSPRTTTIEISNAPREINGPGTPELNVQTETIVNLQGAVTLDWLPDGTMLVADFGGRVYYQQPNRSIFEGLLLDISDQVNGARGMTAMRLHPDLQNNPYIYLGFVYDPPDVNSFSGLAGPDGLGNRASRLIRLTLDANDNYRSVIPESEVVLLGKNSTWNNFNAFVDSTVDFDEPPAGINPDGTNVNDFLAADSQAHFIGDLQFGPDGALYVSNGDGTSFNAVDPRSVRVQDIDNLSGKVLRIDPVTGRGLPDNPFFNGNSNANRSKVYQYGFRNPFRIAFDGAGQLYVGDVGWFLNEEVNKGPTGANFGWPYFEGVARTPEYELLPEAIAFYNSAGSATNPIVDLQHVEDAIDALILGVIVQDSNLPAEYDGHLLFNHLASGHVRAIEFDAVGNVTQIKTLIQGPAFTTEIAIGPDGDLYFIDFASGVVGKWIVQV